MLQILKFCTFSLIHFLNVTQKKKAIRFKKTNITLKQNKTKIKQVFEQIGSKTIERFLNGFTNLIFTYGITGSGKTHTISGSNFDGLMPSILSGIFNHDKIKNNKKYSIYVSYLENYMQDAFDLLYDDSMDNDKENFNPYSNQNNNLNKGNKIKIRALDSERVDYGSLTSNKITNAQQALQLIQSGNTKRSNAHTKLNIVWSFKFVFFSIFFRFKKK